VRFKLKHFLFNAFRELFLYHHSSLEFRAKLFAAVIAADLEADECEYALVKEAGMKIYDDGDRADALVLTTREYVEKVIENNGLDIDMLVEDIIKSLRAKPRFADKIDIEQLRPLLECRHDPDIRIYQTRILELFSRLKKEYGTEAASEEGKRSTENRTP